MRLGQHFRSNTRQGCQGQCYMLSLLPSVLLALLLGHHLDWQSNECTKGRVSPQTLSPKVAEFWLLATTVVFAVFRHCWVIKPVPDLSPYLLHLSVSSYIIFFLIWSYLRYLILCLFESILSSLRLPYYFIVYNLVASYRITFTSWIAVCWDPFQISISNLFVLPDLSESYLGYLISSFLVFRIWSYLLVLYLIA